MNPLTRLLLAATTLSLGLSSNALGAEAATPNPIKHSYLVMGARTAIIGEDGQVAWEYKGGTRDGFILPNGNLLAAWVDRVEEVSPSKQVVGTYVRSAENSEIGTVQRLYNGNTLVTELGKRPRLLEVDTQGKIVRDVPLQPETDNAHMQTRMARQLRNGNYLVPHLLAFAVKEYTPEGQVVATIRTDLAELGGRPQENWPFTAIRLDNGNTLVSLTHGNKVAEFNTAGQVVWKITTTMSAASSRIPAAPSAWPTATPSWVATPPTRGSPWSRSPQAARSSGHPTIPPRPGSITSRSSPPTGNPSRDNR
jgi:hypothetical protein